MNARFVLLKALLLFGFLVNGGRFLNAHAALSANDSLDAIHYEVFIDTVINTTPLQRIYAHTRVTFRCPLGLTQAVELDLVEMQIDSLKMDGVSSAYTYNDTILRIARAGGYAQGDTHVVEIWYQGKPIKDPSFGGFYFAGSHVFNIGVGFNADPVNLGRVWIPSHDNFTDRATYGFHIRVDSGLVAACNGHLTGQMPHPDGSQTWSWALDDDIPVYLAGVSIAPYVIVEDEFVSISGDTIPFQIFAGASDTISAKNQSINIKAAVQAFEQRLGAYQWDRLGYVLVNMPISGTMGAMEHATNIVYPRYFLTQGLGFETIWAHEAGHAWFGNLTTCESESQMWLNEGWATFTEYLFTEAIYGPAAYKTYFRSIHADVLRRAHIEEGGYHALSAIPHPDVYGRTVYSKGSTLAYGLRHQIGDSLFFPAVRQYLQQYAHSHVHTDSLEKSLEASTQMELTPFFDGWINQGGAPHFRVDSFIVTSGGPMNIVSAYVSQRLRGATQMVGACKAQVQFVGAQMERQTVEYTLDGANDTLTAMLSFVPVAIALDPEELLPDATTDNYHVFYSFGTRAFPNTYFTALVDQVQDSAWLRCVHNWVGPDGSILPVVDANLNNSRYWTIEGTFPAGFDARGQFFYNGSTNATSGLLDHTWLTMPEDSLVLLFRRQTGAQWELAPGQTHLPGSPADKVGSFMVDPVRKGDYCLGYYNRGTTSVPDQEPMVEVWPNPNDGSFHMRIQRNLGMAHIMLINEAGQTIENVNLQPDSETIDFKGLAPGIYFLTIQLQNGQSSTKRIAVVK